MSLYAPLQELPARAPLGIARSAHRYPPGSTVLSRVLGRYGTRGTSCGLSKPPLLPICRLSGGVVHDSNRIRQQRLFDDRVCAELCWGLAASYEARQEFVEGHAQASLSFGWTPAFGRHGDEPMVLSPPAAGFELREVSVFRERLIDLPHRPLLSLPGHPRDDDDAIVGAESQWRDSCQFGRGSQAELS